eukprot:391275-Pleurochrysis_carterae.AAC.1
MSQTPSPEPAGKPVVPAGGKACSARSTGPVWPKTACALYRWPRQSVVGWWRVSASLTAAL